MSNVCEGKIEIEKDYVLRKMSGVNWTEDITSTDDAMRYLLIMACVICQIENLCFLHFLEKMSFISGTFRNKDILILNSEKLPFFLQPLYIFCNNSYFYLL